ncbi:MAG TPA: SGNH/GDSL hydrolase family protein [Chloroflexota bacterium]|nr:SGNH/GDSL hydrolase family protein [Chloroflexota bacterium]
MKESAGHWVGTWTSTPAPIETIDLVGRTVRMAPRVSIGGSRLRLRLSNAYGPSRLTVGPIRVALRLAGDEAAKDSVRPVTFGGLPVATIPAGALAVSDPVELEVPPLADLAVSVYLPADIPGDFCFTGHSNSRQTSYISPVGCFVDEPRLPVGEATQAVALLSAVEVWAPPDVGGIVAFGDSLTDGNLSTVDAHARWPDELARRLAARRGGRRLGVMNQGFGGNRILFDTRAESGLRRFDRDVLAQSGVTHVIVLLGINDIRNRNQRPSEVVTAEEMIRGLEQLVIRAHAHGLKVLGGTLLTFEHETFNPGFYTPEGEAKRQAVNEWIRSSGAFDAVIDFEGALRDPSHPTRMLPMYDCGDHLHPSDAGYRRMGQIIDLALFD